MGLRPLAVHFDNTWNSTIATQNIGKLTKKLDIDLYTHVVNNAEYDDIYRSFFSAGVPDIEVTFTLSMSFSTSRGRYRSTSTIGMRPRAHW